VQSGGSFTLCFGDTQESEPEEKRNERARRKEGEKERERIICGSTSILASR